MKAIRPLLFAILGLLSTWGVGQTNPEITIDLGPARSYNGFFFENFTSNNSDTQGRLAMGGTGALNNYSVGDQLDAGTAGDVLVVQNNLSFPNGRVYFGNILVGGQGSGVGSSVINGLAPGAVFQDNAPIPIDFASARTYFQDLSQELRSLPANTSFQFQYGGFQLQGDGVSALQVFHLDGKDVESAHTFNVSQIPENAWVIFNIDNKNAGLTNMSMESLSSHRSRVLFNFHEATNLKLRGISVQGSVLAPLAHVANPQGVLHGQIVAKSWNGPMQLNWVPFEGTTAGSANRPPVFTSVPGLTATAGQAYSYPFTVQDPDGDAVVVELVTFPTGMTLDLTGATLNWLPNTSDLGSHPMELRATDSQGLSTSQTFTLQVLPEPTSGGNCLDLGAAAPYNGFFFQNFSAPSSDTEGRLAIGGDGSLNNYSVGDKLSPGTAGDVLLVGGDLTFPSGRVYYGNILVGGSAAGVGSAVINGLDPGAQLLDHTSLPIDFAQAEQDLKSRSLAYREFPSNTEVLFQWGGFTLTGDGISEVQVFNLNGADVLSAHTFNVTNIPTGAWVVFNISGTQAGLTNMSMQSLVPHRQRVLYNFYQATSLTLAGISVEGSILAPWAHLENPQGVIQGQIVAQSWNGMMQLNHQPFIARAQDCTANQPPQFTSIPPESAIALEPYSYFATATDPDGEALIFAVSQGPVGLTVDGTSGLLTWTPAESQVGNHSVTLTVTDPHQASDTQSYSITVSEPANRPPVITSVAVASAMALEAYSYQVVATDPDGDALAFALPAAPDGMTIDPATGLIAWTPTEDQVGNHPVQVTATDPDGLAATQDFTIAVGSPANRPPVITSDAVTTAMALEAYAYQVIANDPDGDSLAFGITTAPDGMTIDPATGLIAWTPTEDQVGNHSVQVTATDPDGLAATQDFTIAVGSPANRPPVITSDAVTTAMALEAYSYQVVANDPDGDTLAFALPTAPDGMTIDPATGLIAWTPTEDQVGNHPVQVTATDPDGLAATQDFSVAVEPPPNLPPVFISIPVLQTFAEQAYVYQVTAEDPESDPLIFALAQSPEGMLLDSASGALTWTPSLEQLGVHAIRIAVKDSALNETFQEFDLEVIEYDPSLDQFEIAWDSPSSGFLTKEPNVAFSGQIPLGQASAVTLDGQPANITGTQFQGTLLLPDEGMRWLYLNATSVRNHQIQKRRHIIVDRTAPEILVDGGLAQTGSGETLTLRGSLNDQWDANPSVSIQNHPELGAQVKSFAFAGLTEDLFPLTLVATDQLGNTREATVTWTRPNTTAISVVLTATPSTGVAGSQVQLQALADSNGNSPVSSLRLFQLVDGEEVLLSNTNQANLTHRLFIDDFSPAGAWLFRAVAEASDGSSGEDTLTLPIGGDVLLEGRVYDAATGHPLAATVTLLPGNQTLTSDGQGAYRLWNTAAVDRILVSLSGYLSCQLEGPFVAGQVLTLPDARLTAVGSAFNSASPVPLTPAQILAAAANPELAASNAATVSQRSQLSWNNGSAILTQFSNQGLPLPLPLGWQPHSAFHTGENATGTGVWQGPALASGHLVSTRSGEPGWLVEGNSNQAWSIAVEPQRSYVWAIPDTPIQLQAQGTILQALPGIDANLVLDAQVLNLTTNPEVSLARSGIQSVAVFDYPAAAVWSGQRAVMSRMERYQFPDPNQPTSEEAVLPQQAILYRTAQGGAQGMLPLVPRQDALLNQVSLAEIGGPATHLEQRMGQWVNTEGLQVPWTPGWEFSVQTDDRFWLRLEPTNQSLPKFEHWTELSQFQLDFENRSANPIFEIRRTDPSTSQQHAILLRSIANSLGASLEVVGTSAPGENIQILSGVTWRSGHYVLMALELPPILGQVQLVNGTAGEFRTRNSPLGGNAPGWLVLTPGRHFLQGLAANQEEGELSLNLSGSLTGTQTWVINTKPPVLELLRSDPVSGMAVDLSPQFYLEFSRAIEPTSITPDSLTLKVNGEQRKVDWIWEQGNLRVLGRLAKIVEDPENHFLQPGDSLSLAGTAAIQSVRGLALRPFTLNFSVPAGAMPQPLTLENFYILYSAATQTAQIKARGQMGPIGTTAYFNNGAGDSTATAIETGSPALFQVNLPGRPGEPIAVSLVAPSGESLDGFLETYLAAEPTDTQVAVYFSRNGGSVDVPGVGTLTFPAGHFTQPQLVAFSKHTAPEPDLDLQDGVTADIWFADGLENARGSASFEWSPAIAVDENGTPTEGVMLGQALPYLPQFLVDRMLAEGTEVPERGLLTLAGTIGANQLRDITITPQTTAMLGTAPAKRRKAQDGWTFGDQLTGDRIALVTYRRSLPVAQKTNKAMKNAGFFILNIGFVGAFDYKQEVVEGVDQITALAGKPLANAWVFGIPIISLSGNRYQPMIIGTTNSDGYYTNHANWYARLDTTSSGPNHVQGTGFATSAAHAGFNAPGLRLSTRVLGQVGAGYTQIQRRDFGFWHFDPENPTESSLPQGFDVSLERSWVLDETGENIASQTQSLEADGNFETGHDLELIWHIQESIDIEHSAEVHLNDISISPEIFKKGAPENPLPDKKTLVIRIQKPPVGHHQVRFTLRNAFGLSVTDRLGFTVLPANADQLEVDPAAGPPSILAHLVKPQPKPQGDLMAEGGTIGSNGLIRLAFSEPMATSDVTSLQDQFQVEVRATESDSWHPWPTLFFHPNTLQPVADQQEVPGLLIQVAGSFPNGYELRLTVKTEGLLQDVGSESNPLGFQQSEDQLPGIHYQATYVTIGDAFEAGSFSTRTVIDYATWGDYLFELGYAPGKFWEPEVIVYKVNGNGELRETRRFSVRNTPTPKQHWSNTINRCIAFWPNQNALISGDTSDSEIPGYVVIGTRTHFKDYWFLPIPVFVLVHPAAIRLYNPNDIGNHARGGFAVSHRDLEIINQVVIHQNTAWVNTVGSGIIAVDLEVIRDYYESGDFKDSEFYPETLPYLTPPGVNQPFQAKLTQYYPFQAGDDSYPFVDSPLDLAIGTAPRASKPGREATLWGAGGHTISASGGDNVAFGLTSFDAGYNPLDPQGEQVYDLSLEQTEQWDVDEDLWDDRRKYWSEEDPAWNSSAVFLGKGSLPDVGEGGAPQKGFRPRSLSLLPQLQTQLLPEPTDIAVFHGGSIGDPYEEAHGFLIAALHQKQNVEYLAFFNFQEAIASVEINELRRQAAVMFQSGRLLVFDLAVWVDLALQFKATPNRSDLEALNQRLSDPNAPLQEGEFLPAVPIQVDLLGEENAALGSAPLAFMNDRIVGSGTNRQAQVGISQNLFINPGFYPDDVLGTRTQSAEIPVVGTLQESGEGPRLDLEFSLREDAFVSLYLENVSGQGTVSETKLWPDTQEPIELKSNNESTVHRLSFPLATLGLSTGELTASGVPVAILRNLRLHGKPSRPGREEEDVALSVDLQYDPWGAGKNEWETVDGVELPTGRMRLSHFDLPDLPSTGISLPLMREYTNQGLWQGSMGRGWHAVWDTKAFWARSRETGTADSQMQLLLPTGEVIEASTENGVWSIQNPAYRDNDAFRVVPDEELNPEKGNFPDVLKLEWGTDTFEFELVRHFDSADFSGISSDVFYSADDDKAPSDSSSALAFYLIRRWERDVDGAEPLGWTFDREGDRVTFMTHDSENFEVTLDYSRHSETQRRQLNRITVDSKSLSGRYSSYFSYDLNEKDHLLLTKVRSDIRAMGDYSYQYQNFTLGIPSLGGQTHSVKSPFLNKVTTFTGGIQDYQYFPFAISQPAGFSWWAVNRLALSGYLTQTWSSHVWDEDQQGLLTSVAQRVALGDENESMAYSFDDQGRKTSYTRNGQNWEMTWDAWPETLISSDPLGVSTVTTFDDLRRVKTLETLPNQAPSSKSEYQYHGNTQLVESITHLNGQVERMEIDSEGRYTRIEDGIGGVIHLEDYVRGSQLAQRQSQETAMVERYSFDVLGRTTSYTRQAEGGSGTSGSHSFQMTSVYRPNGETHEYKGAYGLNYTEIYTQEVTPTGYKLRTRTEPADALSSPQTYEETYTPWDQRKAITLNGTVIHSTQEHGLGGPKQETPTWEVGANSTRQITYQKTMLGYVPSQITQGSHTIWSATFDSYGRHKKVTDHLSGLVTDLAFNDAGNVTSVVKTENGKALEEVAVVYHDLVSQTITRNGIAYQLSYTPGESSSPTGATIGWTRTLQTVQGNLAEYGLGSAYHEVRGSMNRKGILRRMRRVGNVETLEQGQLPHFTQKHYTGDERIYKMDSGSGVMTQEFTAFGDILRTKVGAYTAYELTGLDSFNRRSAWTSAGEKLTATYVNNREATRKQGDKVLAAFSNWDDLGRPQSYQVLDKNYQVAYTQGLNATETVTEVGTGNFVRRTFDGLGRTIRKELNFPNRALYNVRWAFQYGRGIGTPGIPGSPWFYPGDQLISLSISHDFGGLQKEFEYNEFREVTQVYSFGQPVANKRAPEDARVHQLAYLSEGSEQCTVINGPEGFVSERRFNANGDLIEVKENGLVLLKRDYDAQNRLIREVDFQGEISTFSYEGNATQPYLETHVAGDERWATRYTYDSGNRLIAKISRLPLADENSVTKSAPAKMTTDGVHWRYVYDEFGRLLETYRSAHSDPEKLWEKNTYDPVSGALVSRMDASGLLWTMGYDAETGRMTLRSNSEGLSESWNYANEGLTVTYQRTGSDAVVTEYDVQGRVLERRVGADKVWSYSYQPNSALPATELGPDGRAIQRTFDDFGNLATEELSYLDQSRTVTYQFDDLDRLIGAQTSDGQALTLDYDSRGFLTSESWTLRNHTSPLVTRYGYDNRGNQTSVIYPSNRLVQRQFNQAGRLTGISEGGHQQVLYQYDPLGQLQQVDKVGATATYNYDTYGRLRSHRQELMAGTPLASTRLEEFEYGGSPGHPDNITAKHLSWGQMALSERYSYTPYNQLKEHEVLSVSQVPGISVGLATYHYATNMQLERLETPYGDMVQSFNSDGSLKTQRFQGQTTHYAYDPAGRMQSEIIHRDEIGPNGFERHFTYDMAGHLSSLSERGPPNSEERQEFEYDFFGRMRAQHNANLTDLPWNVYTLSAPIRGEESPLPIPSARGTLTQEVLIPGSAIRPEAQVLGYVYGAEGLSHVTSFPTDNYSLGRIAPQITDAGQNTIGMMHPHDLTQLPETTGLASATYWDLWGNGLNLDITSLANDPAAIPPNLSLSVQFGSEFGIQPVEFNVGDLGSESLPAAGSVFAAQARHKLIPGFAGKLMLGGFLTPDPVDPEASTVQAVSGLARSQLAGIHAMDTRLYNAGAQSFAQPDQWQMFSPIEDPHSVNRFQYANANPVMNWDPDGRLAALKHALNYGSLPGNLNDIAYPEKAWAPSNFEAVLGDQAPLILDGMQFFLAMAELGTEIAAIAVPHPAAKAALKAASFAFGLADLAISAMRGDSFGATLGAIGMVNTLASTPQGIGAKVGKVVRAAKFLTTLREFRHLSYALQAFGLSQAIAPLVFDGGDLGALSGDGLGNESLLLQANWLSSQSSNCFLEGTSVWTASGAIPIEELHLGQRVLSEDFDPNTELESQINSTTWRKVSLLVPPLASNQVPIHIELLRPESWILAMGASEGEWLYLVLEEMGFQGLAQVLAVDACPIIEDGPGQVVTATLSTSSDALLKITTQDGKDLWLTKNHQIYDQIHQQWVPAAHLKPGTTVSTLEGSLEISTIEFLQGLFQVYNLEVENTHNYFAGDAGILGHNTRVLRKRVGNKTHIQYYYPKSGITYNVMLDQQNRITSVFAQLDKNALAKGSTTTDSSRKWVRLLGSSNDDAGHLLANYLGGPGGKRGKNVFPQAPSINRGEFRVHEDAVASFLQGNANHQIYIRVNLKYAGNGTRPHQVIYQSRIDGVTFRDVFGN